MRTLAIALAATLLLCGRTLAADLTVSVRTAAGAPAPNVVVSVYPPGGGGVVPARFEWPMEMVQRNLQFDPFILVVPVGADVAFPNRDTVRHHVYSFSPAKRFELKLHGRGESHSVKFDKVGVAAVGCNIHDGMIGFIKIVDTPFAQKTGPSGDVVFRNVPPGSVAIRVWHPYLRAPKNELVRQAALAQTGSKVAVAVDVRTPPPVHHSY